MQLSYQLHLIDEVELVSITQETGWKNIGLKTTFFLIRLLLTLPGIVRREKPDIILFSSMVTGSLSYFLRKRISVPMVSISHGHDVTLDVGIYQWLLPRVFSALDGVISVSSATQQACTSRGLKAEKSQVLPNGFDMRDLENPYSKKEARRLLEEKIGLTADERPLLLTVGRLIKRKGHRWFIQNVLPKTKSNVRYLVIGDGAEKKPIEYAREQSVQKDAIILAGRQTDEILGIAYAAADVFIMPNVKVPGDMEGFGVVLLEANLRNTPAIASDIEGIRDVISQGDNGYRIKAGEAGAFASKIDHVLSKELETLSGQSRLYVKDQFSWVTVAHRYVSYLKAVAGHHHT
jgi:phosphatidylinositol alpha-1,6-mannosyltransferase